MDIEFIICWDNQTWTTEIKTYDRQLICEKNDYEIVELCDGYLKELVEKCASAEPHGSFQVCSPVHVGIYHINEES
jgi:hypothetical protein